MNTEFIVRINFLKHYIEILLVDTSQENLGLVLSNLCRILYSTLGYNPICKTKQVGNSFLVRFTLKQDAISKEDDGIKLLEDFLKKIKV
jgi:hypothetical protein